MSDQSLTVERPIGAGAARRSGTAAARASDTQEERPGDRGRPGAHDTSEPVLAGLTWLAVLRPVLLTVVLGTALLIDRPTGMGLSWHIPALLLLAAHVVSGIYAATRSWTVRWPWLIDAHLSIDVVTISTIVLLTGGLRSNFVPLYVLPILAGSVLRLTHGGLLIAGLSAGLLGLIVASQFGLVVPHPQAWGLIVASLELPSPQHAFYFVSLHGLAFFAVARLTGYLAENLYRTDLKLQRAAHSLRDLKAYNQHVIDSLTGGLAATDVHGRVLMFNRAAESITAEMAISVLGRNIAEVLQLPGALRRSLGEILETGRPRRTEIGFMRHSGQVIDVGISIGPLLGATGQVGYLFAFQDLTEYKRREREEQRQKRLAAVGEMAAGIAHEIRNPLASMSGSMQVLRQELSLTLEQTQLFEIILRESDRLNDTIRNFLAYARPQPPRSSSVDLRVLLTDAAQLIRNSPECQSRHRVDVDVPDADVGCQADEGQLRQIVWNLATNGLRAMPDGGCLTLSARRIGELPAAAQAGEGVVIRVRDEGVGIAPDDLDRIFQPFHGSFSKGAGLGLSIVHRLVTDRGGEIGVSSEKGKGTTVEVLWPARDLAREAGQGRADLPADTAAVA